MTIDDEVRRNRDQPRALAIPRPVALCDYVEAIESVTAADRAGVPSPSAAGEIGDYFCDDPQPSGGTALCDAILIQQILSQLIAKLTEAASNDEEYRHML
jgi:hypothetical protein